jgi:hypothetical protein
MLSEKVKFFSLKFQFSNMYIHIMTLFLDEQ